MMKARAVLDRCATAGLALTLFCVLFAVAPSAQADAAGCFATPSACGYPDATNTGVPAGTALTPATTRTVTANGTVLSGLEITGTVTVAADNVTIKDSKIVATKGGSGSWAVILNEGADNFTIEHTEIVGPAGNSNGIESAVWNHYGNPGTVSRYNYFHHCADCWEGSGRFENDYMVVDASYPGSHNEDIYVCGGAVDVEHSTLLNTYPQTATVFGDTSGCGGNTFEVKNSLLAGGGYVLYPQGNAGSPTGSMNISGNRFARCTNGAVYDSGSGGTYCNGRTGDANGYYPYGGFFGLAAYYFSGTGNIWSNNVWDDNSRPVCANGSEGCGSVTPPPTGPPVEEPPAEEPPAEEPPVEEPVTEPPVEEPSGGGRPPADPLEAVLSLPGEILVDLPILLDGSGSSGPGAITCTWSIRTPDGNASRSGCLADYTFADPGDSSVRLTVRSGRGTDSVSKNVTVLPAQAATAPGGSSDGSSGEAEPSPGSGLSPAPDAVETVATPDVGTPASPAQPVAAPDARHAWKAPARIRPGARLRLAAAVPAAGATCTWTIIGERSASTGPTIRRGCVTTLRAPARGTLTVRLTIGAADGSVSTVRRTIRVAQRRRHAVDRSNRAVRRTTLGAAVSSGRARR
jgi:hypothetical protein